MDVGLIDRIYECAALPQLWPDVLDELAQIAGARGGVLFAADLNAGILRWTASPPLVDDIHPLLDQLSFQRAGALGGDFSTRLLRKILESDYRLIAEAMGISGADPVAPWRRPVAAASKGPRA